MSQYAARRLYARLHRQPRTVMRQPAVRFDQRLARHDLQRAQRRHQQGVRLARQRANGNEYRLPIGAPCRVLWL